ncbi:MORN repeat-containing protein [Aequorivita echinoideorum]|uniref:Antitoxin component YwqK of the YwqJK toxin-antitoxin module n=1 Tax=Aequorivita echinoideorum TaxID=1549647 RepID=A0ABS5S2N7_9FLAO|nr:hypothetical protein [Aequorivita echinoideorum]MBT0606672.1 hypothetical protein [Aequorivita echinoideorum]
MKNFIYLLFAITVSSLNAQTEKPIFQDLATYAPINPEQGDSYYLAPLHNKNVANIMAINSMGQPLQKIDYDQEGRPTTYLTPTQTNTYSYSPDGRKVVVNNLFHYNLDDKGNVLKYYEQDSYNNTIHKKTENTYDEKGNLVQIEFFKQSPVGRGRYDLQSQYISNYQFDDKNRKIAEIGKNYQYNYDYKITNDQLIITGSKKSGEKMSESIYDKNGILTKYSYFLYGTKITEYIKNYNQNGLLIQEKVTSTVPNENKATRYIITYKDGTVEGPDNSTPQFIDAKKTNNVYTKATTDFSSQEGFFEKGKLNGPGFMQENGMGYKGDFKDGKLNGFGQIYFALGKQKITFGMFKDGVLNGHGFVVEMDPVLGPKVTEAGIYTNGKLNKDLAKDLLSKKATYTCEGNCQEGFGIKKEGDTLTYSFFENGKEIGPYFTMKNKQLVQYGAKFPDYHFLEGLVEADYYLGLWNTKKGKAKIVKKTATGVDAGIIEKGKFETKYEVVLK